ncbi:hypothetical protein ABT340_39645 [Streptosporangium sp. NPDC000239]|uniref:hypothetical protein n=1 Tax=Streptosporangium sp. NPDC000239 TaxID=3154248 RepID=UPI00331D795E
MVVDDHCDVGGDRLMARRMIKVRHRVTGDITEVSERAYPLFAAAYERLDQPDTPAPEPEAKPAPGATEDASTSRSASRSPRPAATTDKE